MVGTEDNLDATGRRRVPSLLCRSVSRSVDVDPQGGTAGTDGIGRHAERLEDAQGPGIDVGATRGGGSGRRWRYRIFTGILRLMNVDRAIRTALHATKSQVQSVGEWWVSHGDSGRREDSEWAR